MSESGANILGVGPNNAFQISFQPDLQIDNGYFNKPIMAHTEILVHMVGVRTSIFVLFQTDLTRCLINSIGSAG